MTDKLLSEVEGAAVPPDLRRERKLLAERIVKRLFTNGAKQRAERLILSKDGSDLGGWGFGPAVDQVYAELAAGVPPVPQPPDGETKK